MSGGSVPIWKKYTSGSKGIWEKFRLMFSLVPNRSTGNPVVSLFRQSPPGNRIQEAREYKDPVTIPAGDIRNNSYQYKDFRRSYPQVHGFDQSKVSGLLKLGSAQSPRISIGEKGNRELQLYNDPQTPVNLSTTLASVDPQLIKNEVLGEQGGPIVAPSLHKFLWKIVSENQHGMYSDDYPCRMFTEAKPESGA